MEERRLLLAVALSLLVLTAYQLLFPPPPRARRPQRRRRAPAAPARRCAAPTPTAGRAERPRAAPAAPAAPVAPIADERERRVEVEGPDVALAFTNRGARLLSWQLNASGTRAAGPRRWCRPCPAGRGPSTSRRATRRSTRGCARRCSALRRAPDARAEGARASCASSAPTATSRREKTLRFQAPGLPGRGRRPRSGAPAATLPVRVHLGPGLGNPTAAEMEVQGYHAPQARLPDGPDGRRARRRPRRSAAAARCPARAGRASRARTSPRCWVPPDARRRPSCARSTLPPGEDGKPQLGAAGRGAPGAASAGPALRRSQGPRAALQAGPRPGTRWCRSATGSAPSWCR